MALQHSPKIVTDNLVLCLDPSQNTSFPSYDLPVKGGLLLWLDASDDTTFSYSSSTSVSQWRDKSRNNFHASQSTVANQASRTTTQNSRKTVNFDGTNDFLTINNFLCNSEMSIFVVSNCGNTLFIEQSVDANSNNGFYLYGGGGGMIKIYRSGSSTIISNSNWLSGGYSIATGVNSTGLDLLTYKNGTQQTIITDGRTALTNSYTTNTLYIGSRAGSSIFTNGPIAEIIIYNRKLSTTELYKVHTYLGLKWGISNTDRSIIDLSGNNNNGLLGNGTVADMPLFDYYNKGAIKLDGTNDYIAVADNVSLNPSTVTVSIWVKRNGYQSTTANFLRRNYNDAYSILGYANNNDNVRFRIYNGSTYPDSPNTSLSLNEWTNIVGTYDLANIKIYKNGVFVGQTAHTSAISYSSSNTILTIGRDDPVAGRYMDANYGPVLIYNRALSAAEVAQNYEAQKTKFTNAIVQQGLVLNLDAGNPYSYAGAGTTWYDVSASNKNFTLTSSGITWSSNGTFSLTDTGSATISSSITASTTCTVIFWLKTTDTQSLFLEGNTNGFYLGAYYVGQGFYNNNCGSPTYWVDLNSVSNPNPTYLDGNWHMWEMKNVDFSTWTQTKFNTYSGFTFSNGAIGQIMIYNRNLSAAESLQIYNATKSRFGL